MAFRTRNNPKTGKIEYSYRYYYIKNGKKVDTNTGWFSTQREAQRNGEAIKARKESEEVDIVFQRQNKLVRTAFNEFLDEYEKLATRDTTENTCTDVSIWKRAKTIKEKYFPIHIQNTRVGKITPSLFRDWLLTINDYDISGAYVRSLKATLSKFNKWLRDNGYYEDKNLDLDIDLALQRTTVKSKTYKNRERLGQRKVLTVSEIERVCDYFFDLGIEEFKNFYYYTLYYVLFYSGMRIEELIALQWKFVKGKFFYLENAINEREKRSNVYERIKKGIYYTKNQKSNRVIPIFDFYFELLIDYKNSYRFEFNLTEEEMEDCFVFPKLKNHNPYEYQAGDRLTIVLQKVLKELNIDKTDCQMFRHSCATFLILPYPEGLGYEEDQVIDYFGHSDTEMLRDVYARIKKEQRAKRLQHTFSEYFTPDKTLEQTAESNTQSRLIERIGGDNPEALEKRKERIFKQIDKAIVRNQKEYIYLKKDRKIIKEYKRKHPSDANLIHLIEED